MCAGLWAGSNSLEQLPHFGEEEIKSVTTAPTKNGKAQAKTLAEFLRVPNDDKKGLSTLSAEKRDDVIKVCSLIPNLKIETKLYVEEEEEDFLGDEDDSPADKKKKAATTSEVALKEKKDEVAVISGDTIYEGDLVTLRVTLTRENITEIKGKAPPVHAPYFPKTIRENWWLILTDRPAGRNPNDPKRAAEANIHAFEKISDQSRVVKHEIRFMAPPKVGTYAMELQVLSDCYMGLDEVIPIEFTVHPATDLPEYAPHPEDKDLDNEPTLFEQVMAANLDESSDEEDEDDEEGDADGADKKDKKKVATTGPAAAAAAKANKKGGNVVVEDVEDSEEED